MIMPQGPGVYKSIMEYKMQPHIRGCLSDIKDGLLFRYMFESALLNDKSISLVLNTDGVNVFKSNKFSIWPVLLMINELPFTDRYLLHHQSTQCIFISFFNVICLLENNLRI